VIDPFFASHYLIDFLGSNQPNSRTLLICERQSPSKLMRLEDRMSRYRPRALQPFPPRLRTKRAPSSCPREVHPELRLPRPSPHSLAFFFRRRARYTPTWRSTANENRIALARDYRRRRSPSANQRHFRPDLPSLPQRPFRHPEEPVYPGTILVCSNDRESK
jgi:hypothetical protein